MKCCKSYKRIHVVQFSSVLIFMRLFKLSQQTWTSKTNNTLTVIAPLTFKSLLKCKF